MESIPTSVIVANIPHASAGHFTVLSQVGNEVNYPPLPGHDKSTRKNMIQSSQGRPKRHPGSPRTRIAGNI